MKLIENTSYEGERPCFALSGTRLIKVRFNEGESALKQGHALDAQQCEFLGKYPFWHCEDVAIEDCLFNESARAAIWYSRKVSVANTRVEAPKMFRELNGLTLNNVKFTNADESGWNCQDIDIENVDVETGDYVFMNGKSIRVKDSKFLGDYSFQNTRNVEVYGSHIRAKDAFWGSENVTIYDSLLEGEYLGWHSKNLRLINCKIRGTQPLCYATNLIMEDCEMENTDLCFEYSTLNANIISDIQSVKNPKSGRIFADRIETIIIDEHCPAPGSCIIEQRCSSSAA